MRVCYNCQPPRLNLGRPDFCQYCGTSFGSRICLHCRAHNSADAARCGGCGRGELSELGAPAPAWTRLLSLGFWGAAIGMLWKGAEWMGAAAVQLTYAVLPLAVGALLCLALLPPSLREMALFLLRALWAPLRGLALLLGRGLTGGWGSLFFGGSSARRR